MLAVAAVGCFFNWGKNCCQRAQHKTYLNTSISLSPSLYPCVYPSLSFTVFSLSLSIIRPADGKKGESPPSFTRSSLLKCSLCVSVCVFGSRPVVAEEAGGFSGEQLPWKRAPVSVVLLQQYRRRGRWRGERWASDLRGRGRMEGGRELGERDRARLKGH